MGNVSFDLLNKFAKIIIEKSNGEKMDANIGLYGTVIVDSVTEQKMVLIDGCTSATPIYEAMDATNGDRVLVSIKDHRAIVTGNLSAPASAKQATDFLKPVEGGFLIGELRDGTPIVAYIVLKETEILFVSFNGKVMGSFSTVDTRLGHDKNTIIRLCGDTGTIKWEDETGFIFSMDDYVEIDTKKNSHFTKIISSSRGGDPHVSIEMHNSTTDSDSKVDISDGGFEVTIPEDAKATINGKNILTSGGESAGDSETFVTMETLKSFILESVYPIGTHYASDRNVSPQSFLGGTWVSIGEGRTIVGVDPNQPDFNASGKTGGTANTILLNHNHPLQNHTHPYSGTTNSSGAHEHSLRATGDNASNLSGSNPSDKGYVYRYKDQIGGAKTNSAGAHTHTYSGNTGQPSTNTTGAAGTAAYANSNYPPYITSYIWKRTA